MADALDDDRLAEVIEELPEDDQMDLLVHLDEARAADVLEAMEPDDAADLLGELPEGVQTRLLELMEPEESAPVRRLLQYSFDTAGGLMTPEPVVLTPDATVAEALARVRSPDLTPALASMVFVARPPQATPTGRYLGCVHTQRLLREPPFELVAGIGRRRDGPAVPGCGAAGGDPVLRGVQPGVRDRSSTTRTTCSAR